jgi:hypothetical protein
MNKALHVIISVMYKSRKYLLNHSSAYVNLLRKVCTLWWKCLRSGEETHIGNCCGK